MQPLSRAIRQGRDLRLRAEVYSALHVGNAAVRGLLVLKRFLEHEGYDVDLVTNVTDVNDKIYDAATEAGVASTSWRAR